MEISIKSLIGDHTQKEVKVKQREKKAMFHFI